MTPPPLAACPPLVIDFAHSDPTTGGGLQAGLLTFASLGVQPMTVTTAITVQDTAGIVSSLILDAEWVEDQARALLEDVPVAAFRVGFLGSVEQVSAVAAILADYDEIPLVLSPSVTRLLRDEGLEDEIFEALYDLLLPQAAVVVIDIGDVPRLIGDVDQTGDASLTGLDPQSNDGPAGTDDPGSAGLLAARLLDAGCASVLLTGVPGTAAGQRSNLLFADGGLRFTHRWESRADGLHGAGEAVAVALAAGLACADELLAATRNAHEYTAQAIAACFRPGMGRVLPDRFFWARPEAEAKTGAQDSTGAGAVDGC